ncbi:MAG: DDE-type integrase/transposase/recombinase [Solirubrobacteraceae bacterium]
MKARPLPVEDFTLREAQGVLRLTRGAGLLAPTGRVRKRAQRLHDGTITVSVPDTLWATDATEGWTEEGRCAVFVMIDHASGEAWADAGLRMDRFAAADLLREVCRERFGSVEQAVASGLALRYDGGSCFRSEHYQVEIDHLGIARSPAYHYEPEANGCAEKFIETLKGQGAVDPALRHLRGPQERRQGIHRHLPVSATRAPDACACYEA